MKYIGLVAIVLLLIVLFIPVNVKPSARKKSGRKSKEVGKIYKTTDGFLGNDPTNKKTRHVIIARQRRKDGALAVNKIRSRTKKNKQDKNYIPNLVLQPKDHSEISKPSVVETRTIWGVKKKPIYKRDLESTSDRLLPKEYRKLKKGIGGASRKNKRTYKSTARKWESGFSDKKNK